jgi:hypothetical protein
MCEITKMTLHGQQCHIGTACGISDFDVCPLSEAPERKPEQTRSTPSILLLSRVGFYAFY